MSKKTRKKSPKAPSRKAARPQSAASAKKPPSKTRRATANKSGKKRDQANRERYPESIA